MQSAHRLEKTRACDPYKVLAGGGQQYKAQAYGNPKTNWKKNCPDCQESERH